MYTQYYNLTEEPFNLTPDPEFLFLTEGHREALASMLYGIKERKGIISLTGEVGTGKTTLVYSLLNSLDKNVNTVYIYHTNITFEQILDKILVELNIVSFQTDKTSLLQSFNDYLIERLANDEIIAIIIDEAQNLNDNVLEELRMLTNLETSKSKLLQLILVGQPELENKLSSDNLRQLKQRINIRGKLFPLTDAQTVEYIKHRLNKSGCKSNIFNKKAISRICEHSKGIPRNINIICDNALLIGYAKSKNKIDIHIINEVIDDMADVFLIKPGNYKQENINNTETYQTNNLTNYYKIVVSILIVTCIIFILLINKTDLFKQNSSEKAESKNSALSIRQPPPDTLTTDMSTKPNTANSAQINNSAKATPPMELTANNNSTVTVDNVNSKNKPLNLIQTVKAGEGSSLSSITMEHYNNENTTLQYIIMRTNPNIKDIHHLRTEQEIVIPELTLEAPLIKSSFDTYNIELGTFESISKAEKYYKEPILTGEKITIVPRKVSLKDTWYQVILEKHATRKESLATVELLKEKGLLDCFNNPKLNKAGLQQKS